ncbi:hypothetical protein CspeluHIS016_0901350 [Cutaneotrichosporon spelunceum]|uniref:Uncharacterized protein n=1 Tax=Cutaneotrichosporon spelunceum TaxID=1672016 RepID=A0AAD3YF86_9TREE|nr:hypothetical protein CspeluHIS016_0901350 [Cutaneotrichosporon spelunceum]
MASPPRMLLLCLWGTEQFCALPQSYDKAIALATEKFQVPATHMVRLSCPVRELPHYIAGYTNNTDLFIMDNDSYHYACANKHVVRLDVNIHEKLGKPGGGGGGGDKGGGDKGAEDKGKGGEKKEGGEKKDGGKPAPKSAPQTLCIDTTAGKNVSLTATVNGDLAKGPPAGHYLGTLTNGTFAQKFQGMQLGPNEVLTKFYVQEKDTVRLLFRPRSVRPKIDVLFPEESSLEVNVALKGWMVTTAYPEVVLRPDGGLTRLRWFLRVKKGGVVEDLLTGTESHGLFMELLPEAGPRPTINTSPTAPLNPAYPDVRPTNAWVLQQSLFLQHIDRVLNTLGLPPQSRSALITSWLPGITRHKNIAYRILNKEQLDPSSRLELIPKPQALMRLLILFRGIPDGEMKEWAGRQVGSDMGVDWRETVGWTPHLNDEALFRVIEYGAMEVALHARDLQIDRVSQSGLGSAPSGAASAVGP